MCCKALVKEIGRALVRTDKNTQNVDLRGRLDPHGKRHGKVIPYKVSESRVLDILEGDTAEGRSGGLCGAMQDYQPQTSADGVVSLVKVFNNDGEAITLSGGVSIGGDTNNAELRSLKFKCGELLEEHEDEISSAIVNVLPGELERKICLSVAQVCPEARVPAASKSEL